MVQLLRALEAGSAAGQDPGDRDLDLTNRMPLV